MSNAANPNRPLLDLLRGAARKARLTARPEPEPRTEPRDKPPSLWICEVCRAENPYVPHNQPVGCWVQGCAGTRGKGSIDVWEDGAGDLWRVARVVCGVNGDVVEGPGELGFYLRQEDRAGVWQGAVEQGRARRDEVAGGGEVEKKDERGGGGRAGEGGDGEWSEEEERGRSRVRAGEVAGSG